MSEYGREFAKEFAKRTYVNMNQKEIKYPVTQLINSFLGLIVIPIEWGMDIDCEINYKIIGGLRTVNEKNIKNSDIIRHIRNGISHGYIYANSDASDKDDSIREILICDYNPYKYKKNGNSDFLEGREYDNLKGKFDYIFQFDLGDIQKYFESIYGSISD